MYPTELDKYDLDKMKKLLDYIRDKVKVDDFASHKPLFEFARRLSGYENLLSDYNVAKTLEDLDSTKASRTRVAENLMKNGFYEGFKLAMTFSLLDRSYPLAEWLYFGGRR